MLEIDSTATADVQEPSVGTDKEPVNGAALLDNITATLNRFLVLPNGAAEAMALWAVHTYAPLTWTHSPRLIFTAPEPGCGKSAAMHLMERLSAYSEYYVMATEAAVLRQMDTNKAQPHALFFDEADTFFSDKPLLKSALNASFERGGQALINVPTKEGGWTATPFTVWAPVAIAGIGSSWQWPALVDRSIVVKMQKRRPDQVVEEFFEPVHGAGLKALALLIRQWERENVTALRDHKPDMPVGVINREAQKWRPLITIADVAGGQWPELARRVCQGFVGKRPAVSDGAALLAAIRAVFEERGCTALFGEDLVAALNKRTDQPWIIASGGYGFDATDLANLLRPYDIKPARVFINGTQRRGYDRRWFTDAWSRYVPAETKSGDLLT